MSSREFAVDAALGDRRRRSSVGVPARFVMSERSEDEEGRQWSQSSLPAISRRRSSSSAPAERILRSA